MDLIDTLGAKLLSSRRTARAPIFLYRHGLGWVLGSRILMLEHTGRKTELPRYVCLEVVERPSPDRIVIVSGFGWGAQWYRNLAVDPQCRVSTGFHRGLPARARMMSDAEAERTIVDYRRRHPRAWQRLRSVIEKAAGRPVGQLPMVELTLSRKV